MKMRNTVFALFALAAGVASAQVTAESAGENEATLFERVAKIEKKSDQNVALGFHT